MSVPRHSGEESALDSAERTAALGVVHINVPAAWRDEEAAFGDHFCSWLTAWCFSGKHVVPLRRRVGRRQLQKCSSATSFGPTSRFLAARATIRARGSVGVCFVSQLSLSFSQFLAHVGHCHDFHCSHHESKVLLFNAFLLVIFLFFFNFSS